jgi:hypothetical protein
MKKLVSFEDFSVIQEKKWIQAAKLKKGALHRSLGIAEDEIIPISTINQKIASLHAKSELTKKESKLLKRLNLAKTLKSKVKK